MQSRTHSEPGATYTAQIPAIKTRAQKQNEVQLYSPQTRGRQPGRALPVDDALTNGLPSWAARKIARGAYWSDNFQLTLGRLRLASRRPLRIANEHRLPTDTKMRKLELIGQHTFFFFFYVPS